MPKPDDTVAGRIVDELSRKGIVLPEKASSLAVQLAEGRFSAEDWVRLVEQREDRKSEGSRAD